MRSEPFIFQLSGDLSRFSFSYWHSGIIISVTSLSLDHVSTARRATQRLVSPELRGNRRPSAVPLKQKRKWEGEDQFEPMIRLRERERYGEYHSWQWKWAGTTMPTTHLLLLVAHQSWHADFQDDKRQPGLRFQSIVLQQILDVTNTAALVFVAFQTRQKVISVLARKRKIRELFVLVRVDVGHRRSFKI